MNPRTLTPLLAVTIFTLSVLFPARGGASEGDEVRLDFSGEEFKFLDLGVEEDYMKLERYRTIEQINTFIPPLYQPAFVGHGYVLPPGAVRVGLKSTFLNIDPDDFFKGSASDLVHENHSIDRIRTDLQLFYGLDRNMTLFLNIPYWSSNSTGSVHPAGVQTMDLHVEANTQELGDVSLILKKKWVDQGNFRFNFATVVGVKFPTGSNSQKFDQPMVVKQEDGTLATAFMGGPFPRFSDDGRLPQVLQPGTGDFGYTFGLMGTRQFARFPSAFHAGILATILEGEDGIEPGDEVRFFASYVKPLYGERMALDLTVNGMDKGNDKYSGTFMHPFPNPDGTLGGMVTTPRPSFRGGTVAFFSPSLIWTPQPQVRMTATASFRLNEPDLGPWPGSVFQFSLTYTF